MKTKEQIQQDRITILCRAARKASGITLAELSRRTGINAATLSQFENGKYRQAHAYTYYQEVLNDAERATFKAILRSK